MQAYPPLKPGDIAGVKSHSILGKLAKALIVPHTELFHFFLIGDYLPWADDYVILESVNKGIAVGRLSFYDPEEVVIFRRILPAWHYYKEHGVEMKESDELVRKKAAAALTLKGRARYDWFLIVQMLLALPQLILRGKLPPYAPEDIPYGRNKAYICTEAVNFAWRHVGFPLVPEGVCPMPASIKRGIFDGTLCHIYPAPEGCGCLSQSIA